MRNFFSIANCLYDIDSSVDVSNFRATESPHSLSYIASKIERRTSGLESKIH
jgi:hypothetical protein